MDWKLLISIIGLLFSFFFFIINWLRSNYLFKIKEYPEIEIKLIKGDDDYGSVFVELYNRTNNKAIDIIINVIYEYSNNIFIDNHTIDILEALSRNMISIDYKIKKELAKRYPEKFIFEEEIYGYSKNIFEIKQNELIKVDLKINIEWRPALFKRKKLKNKFMYNIESINDNTFKGDGKKINEIIYLKDWNIN